MACAGPLILTGVGEVASSTKSSKINRGRHWREVQGVLRRLMAGSDTLSLFCPWALAAPRCSHSGRTPEAVLSMHGDFSYANCHKEQIEIGLGLPRGLFEGMWTGSGGGELSAGVAP